MDSCCIAAEIGHGERNGKDRLLIQAVQISVNKFPSTGLTLELTVFIQCKEVIVNIICSMVIVVYSHIFIYNISQS